MVDRKNSKTGLDRRQFSGGLAALGLGAALPSGPARAYQGPNVIIVRFGGGVRRAETIEPQTTFAPYLLNELSARGVLIPNMTISALEGVETSHAEGTLNILTGRYLAYKKLPSPFAQQHLEPQAPTLFEYFRKAFDMPAHQALLINGEDRPQEEFFTYGVHAHYGLAFRSESLSLYRFKLYKLRRQLAANDGSDEELALAKKEFDKLMSRDYRGLGARQSPEIEAFWGRWQAHYGRSGFVNPRGDRLLTELALRALDELHPRLMMVNYQDPDYVHWGNASHYTRAIAIIDTELKRLVDHVDADPRLAGNTVFVVVPDCGRDANPMMEVPFQHHFNTKAAHQIWALLFGPGIVRGRVLDKPKDQTAIAATVAGLMGFRATGAETGAITELFA